MNEQNTAAQAADKDFAHELWAAAQSPFGEPVDAAVARVTALLAELRAEGVQAGWQLVPIEPTDAMRQAGAQYAECGISANAVYGYRAMIDAAPLASAPVAGETKPVDDATIKAAYVQHFGSNEEWLGAEGSYFIEGYRAGRNAAPQASALAAEYARGRADGFDAAKAAPQASEAVPTLPRGWQLALNLAIDAIENAAPVGQDWPVNWPAILHGLVELRDALAQPQADKDGGQQRADGVSACNHPRAYHDMQNDSYRCQDCGTVASAIDIYRSGLGAALSPTQPEQGERDA